MAGELYGLESGGARGPGARRTTDHAPAAACPLGLADAPRDEVRLLVQNKPKGGFAIGVLRALQKRLRARLKLAAKSHGV